MACVVEDIANLKNQLACILQKLEGIEEAGLERTKLTRAAGNLKLQIRNLMPVASGDFPMSPEEEFRAQFEIRDPLHQAAFPIAECVLIPPMEIATGYVAPNTPWVNLGPNLQNQRVMPLDVRTVMLNSGIAPRIFEPVLVNESGYLTWRYIGDKPISTTLRGGVKFLMRVAGQVVTPRANVRLRLKTTDHGEIEGNNGTTALGFDHYQNKIPFLFENYHGYADLCMPVTQEIRDAAVAGSWVDLFTGYDNGYFATGSTDETLLTTIGGSPVGPEVRTTQWMDVSAGVNNKLTRCYAIIFSGNPGTRRRVQYKDSSGAIHYWTPMSLSKRSSEAIYRLPPEATEFRVYYSGPGDDPGTPQVLRMSEQLSPEYDPLKGYWVECEFNVHRDVVFYPGQTYCITIDVNFIGEAGTIREWGFRYLSGGFSFLFDSTDLLNNRAAALYGETR